MRLAAASAVILLTGGVIVTIASSPIISTSISKPRLGSAHGVSLMVNPAFQTQRGKSVKVQRLLAARDGQGRTKPLSAEEIRLSYLKPQVRQAGETALTDWQRKLVGQQIAENEDDGSLLAGLPPELKQPAVPAIKTAPVAPSTALAAVSPKKTEAQTGENPFKLVLQGVEDSRTPPGHIPVPAKRPAGMALAYASFRHDDVNDIFSNVPEQTSKVAVYDIEGGKVYMPDGEVMEAHSGKGKYRDDPKYTHVKMAGAVPAATYKLTPREALFHGVPALRMTSVDGTNPLGRTGILAHTYMLRTPGDSHGCLVFKDYYKFLKAYRDGRVDYIVAVPNLKNGKSEELIASR
ncbi:DUF2778 domain-containing protein [Martelella mediterranea]|uniref:Uncharacterized protein DUF2778 n=1 Tax=Martelella mediterranea TaxID=293089 RepID=A0A4R3NVA9_9HYPH|nr:DUF2778 domain-containing protein [Martelella mediterranea]TCT41051.1 uncharacterized protein DUF2778 [Martelella mediterranea]